MWESVCQGHKGWQKSLLSIWALHLYIEKAKESEYDLDNFSVSVKCIEDLLERFYDGNLTYLWSLLEFICKKWCSDMTRGLHDGVVLYLYRLVMLFSYPNNKKYFCVRYLFLLQILLHMMIWVSNMSPW